MGNRLPLAEDHAGAGVAARVEGRLGARGWEAQGQGMQHPPQMHKPGEMLVQGSSACELYAATNTCCRVVLCEPVMQRNQRSWLRCCVELHLPT